MDMELHPSQVCKQRDTSPCQGSSIPPNRPHDKRVDEGKNRQDAKSAEET